MLFHAACNYTVEQLATGRYRAQPDPGRDTDVGIKCLELSELMAKTLRRDVKPQTSGFKLLCLVEIRMAPNSVFDFTPQLPAAGFLPLPAKCLVLAVAGDRMPSWIDFRSNPI